MRASGSHAGYVDAAGGTHARDARSPGASVIPAGDVDAWHGLRDGRTVRLGQRAAGASSSRVGVHHRRPQRHQRRVHGVRRGGRLPRSPLVARRRLGLGRRRKRRRIRRSGSAGGAVVLARHVRAGAAAGELAGLRDLGRSARLCALARPAAADRGGVPSRRLSARPPVSERQYPWGDAAPTAPPGNFDFVRWDPEPVGMASARARAPSACTTRRQRLGVDVDGVRAVPRLSPMPSYPEYSADFFDGEHFVMKGASPVTARGAGAPRLPQLVPAALPVRLRDVPLRGRRRDAVDLADPVDLRPRVRRGSRPSTCSARRASCRRSISTTRSARRCSRRSAGCRGTASRAPSRRCSTPRRARSRAAAAAADDRRARLRQRREAGACCRRALPSASSRFSWSTSRRPRSTRRATASSGCAVGPVAAAPGDLRGRPARLAQARRDARDAGAVPRLEHRQLRSAGRRASC